MNTFVRRIIFNNRVTIPKSVMNALELHKGDLVEVEVHPVEIRRKV